MLVMGLAPITAPLIGGQLLVAFSWRAIFWVLSGFGLLGLLMVLLGLPETLPPERRSRAGLGQALEVYGRLLADRRFVGYALAGGFVAAGMFAYISGSPFVFIELYGVAPTHYGWLFGANALGLVAASQINRRLLARYHGEAILSTTLAVTMERKALALEDLTTIRARVTVRRSQRRMRHSWAFRQLRTFIGYKAQRAGVRVVHIDPRNTSRTCAVCGFCDTRNRPDQAHFWCLSCGHTAAADTNAAVNIARVAAVNQPIVSLLGHRIERADTSRAVLTAAVC